MRNAAVQPETGSVYSSKIDEENVLPDDAKEGLWNVRAITFLLLWYFFSFCTLFLNKYILSYLQGEPTLLGGAQIVMTTILVGCMRFLTVVMGLIALKYISVSFTETVKSTAPIFTVILAWLILRERVGAAVIFSLLPIMGGLAVCSAYELSFHLVGFAAAIATNLMDCLQNVYSKLLISASDYRYTPAELQFYTSVSSMGVQLLASFLLTDVDHALNDLHSRTMFVALLFNGFTFHLQSILAYALMGYISPVTHSVANTVKRAILIWLSVIVFGNEVSLLSAIGTAVVIFGVLLYHKAREYECLLNEARLATKSRLGGIQAL